MPHYCIRDNQGNYWSGGIKGAGRKLLMGSTTKRIRTSTDKDLLQKIIDESDYYWKYKIEVFRD